jgi:hypothetical protein
VLENARTGERLVFRRTAAETNGEALGYEIVFTPSRPALRSAELAETLFDLGRDGKLNAKGNPAPLAALGRLLGYRGTYPRYSGGG